MSIGFEIVRQEAAERAMANYRAKQAVRERSRTAARPTAPRRTGLGNGARRLSREEALQLIAKKSPRGALRLLAQYLAGARDKRGA